MNFIPYQGGGGVIQLIYQQKCTIYSLREWIGLFKSRKCMEQSEYHFFSNIGSDVNLTDAEKSSQLHNILGSSGHNSLDPCFQILKPFG